MYCAVELTLSQKKQQKNNSLKTDNLLVESSSLVSVLFREAFGHPYISFFYLLVYNNNYYHNQLFQTDFLRV